MTDSPADPGPVVPGGPGKTPMRIFAIVAGIVVVGFVALIAWALWTAGKPTPSAPAPRFDRFQSAWASAMAKAGVEATFPVDPVEVTSLQSSGRQSFEATFTAEEITALLNVYPYRGEIAGAEVSLTSAEVEFPDAGRVRLSGSLVADGSGYSAVAEAPVSYADGEITSRGLTSLTVEGFNISGGRRTQAGDGLLQYFNAYLDATPGLTVEVAEVVEGGIVVKGFAPVALTNP